MKSIAFAFAFAATAVVAQEPQDQVVAVDCREHVDCQSFDSGATCMEGMCDCSGDDRSRYCTATAGAQAGTVVKLTLSFVFGEIGCDELDDAIRTQIHNTVLQKVAYTITAYDIVCGSVIVVFGVDAEVSKVDEVLQKTTENMQAVQQDVPVLAKSSLTTDFVFGNETKQCVIENAASTIYLENKICYPTCNSGYNRVETNNGTQTYQCTQGDSDDDLSATAVAAIVIAVVLFCGIIVAAIYYVTGKPNTDVPTQNEPYNEEKPTEEVAGDQHQDVTV